MSKSNEENELLKKRRIQLLEEWLQELEKEEDQIENKEDQEQLQKSILKNLRMK
ncbi:hypothetical protein [Rossellomorea aquimaris]|uniref:Uncharacterized protein n=1 Tax=Rossellomorea aquimaris TaxID=189382 RepID=A0A366EIF1_9BACI|nr:hypothetical protein [Rossellomorea aquimaris]RBP01205.1 hypothetical protein DET59_1206 [Rossellomorea aquimaris]